MNELVPLASSPAALPALVLAAGEQASMRFLAEFFAANIRNPHTRRAYYRAAEEFLTWCARAGVPSIAAVQPVHVATWIEASTRELAAPAVKQRLAALRHLFDWLVNGQVVPANPAHTVRGPRHVVTWANTPSAARTFAPSIVNSGTRLGRGTGCRHRALSLATQHGHAVIVRQLLDAALANPDRRPSRRRVRAASLAAWPEWQGLAFARPRLALLICERPAGGRAGG